MSAPTLSASTPRRPGRPAKPVDPALGPKAVLAIKLRGNRLNARLSLRELEVQIHARCRPEDRCSRGTIQRLEAGKVDPVSAKHVRAHVVGCGGDWAEWKPIFDQFHVDMKVWNSKIATPPGQDSTGRGTPVDPTPSGAPQPRFGRAFNGVGMVIMSVVMAIAVVFGIRGESPATGPTDSAQHRTGPTAPQAPPTFSLPRSMPRLVGMTITEARSVLPRETTVAAVDALQRNAASGTVVGQYPPPGAPLADRVKLTTDHAARAVGLDTLPPAAGKWSTNPRTTPVDRRSLAAEPGTCARPGRVDYNLGATYKRFVGSVGIFSPGTADIVVVDPSLSAEVEILKDDQPIERVPAVNPGYPVALDVDIAGAEKLSLRWNMSGTSCKGNYLRFDDPVLVGTNDG